MTRPVRIRKLRLSVLGPERPWYTECIEHVWGWRSSQWYLAMMAADDHLHDHHDYHRDEDDR